MRWFKKKPPKGKGFQLGLPEGKVSVRSNKCWTCTNYNTTACPYGKNTYCVACNAYIMIGFEGRIAPVVRPYRYTPNMPSCPRCSSSAVRSAGYGDRFECAACGKVFT